MAAASGAPKLVRTGRNPSPDALRELTMTQFDLGELLEALRDLDRTEPLDDDVRVDPVESHPGEDVLIYDEGTDWQPNPGPVEVDDPGAGNGPLPGPASDPGPIDVDDPGTGGPPPPSDPDPIIVLDDPPPDEPPVDEPI